MLLRVWEVDPKDADEIPIVCEVCPSTTTKADYGVDEVFEEEGYVSEAALPNFACAAHIGDLLGNLVKAS